MEAEIRSELLRSLGEAARDPPASVLPYEPYNHPLVTPMMRKVEQLHGTPINVLLGTGEALGVVARRLGLDDSTVYKWRRRLNIGV